MSLTMILRCQLTYLTFYSHRAFSCDFWSVTLTSKLPNTLHANSDDWLADDLTQAFTEKIETTRQKLPYFSLLVYLQLSLWKACPCSSQRPALTWALGRVPIPSHCLRSCHVPLCWSTLKNNQACSRIFPLGKEPQTKPPLTIFCDFMEKVLLPYGHTVALSWFCSHLAGCFYVLLFFSLSTYLLSMLSASSLCSGPDCSPEFQTVHLTGCMKSPHTCLTVLLKWMQKQSPVFPHFRLELNLLFLISGRGIRHPHPCGCLG